MRKGKGAKPANENTPTNGARKATGAAVLQAYRIACLELALADLVEYVRRVGGYMSAEDQAVLRRAEWALRKDEP